tara:strand:+ start:1416 stop:1580 length:165 start_codon:yes stop_codon:yes gene_type:complete
MIEYDEGELIAELLCITGELNGKMERIDGYRSDGRQYKKIVIEYDSKEWKRNEI